MSQRVTIDPITRIEGHLRIDLEVDGGKVGIFTNGYWGHQAM